MKDDYDEKAKTVTIHKHLLRHDFEIAHSSTSQTSCVFHVTRVGPPPAKCARQKKKKKEKNCVINLMRLTIDH